MPYKTTSQGAGTELVLNSAALSEADASRVSLRMPTSEGEREFPGAPMFSPVRFCKYTRNSFVGKPNKGPVICAEQKRGGWRGSAVGGGKAS